MFSRESTSEWYRPIAVWAVVTWAAVAAGTQVPGTWHAVGWGSSEGVEDLIISASATALALALAWLWVITTATVAELLGGRPRAAGGATRRLVLLACGAAVVAGTAAPAVAGGGDGPELLIGLALPDRAVAPVGHAPATSATPATPGTAATYVVRPGDSLWSISRLHPDGSGSVDQRWRAIWQANRGRIGDDPDLIIPGQELRLPPTRTTQHPTTRHPDGDRR